MKHIREALRLTGLRLSDVQIDNGRAGHIQITYKGRKITTG